MHAKLLAFIPQLGCSFPLWSVICQVILRIKEVFLLRYKRRKPDLFHSMFHLKRVKDNCCVHDNDGVISACFEELQLTQ